MQERSSHFLIHIHVYPSFQALWGSWVVKGPNHSFYFAGDTGYCGAFKQIGRKYGPFTLAAIPVGAYEPRLVIKVILSRAVSIGGCPIVITLSVRSSVSKNILTLAITFLP